MKFEKYLIILVAICLLSYYIMFNLTMGPKITEATEIHFGSDYIIKRSSILYDIKDSLIRQERLLKYIQDLTGFDYADCGFMLEECKTKALDPFLILGVIKTESDFNPKARGASGERGLGQLMDGTAKIVAENLGYNYEPDKLFDTRYNLELTITQVNYLYNLYEKDIHKTLTAFNRGQRGLINYMESNKQNVFNPAQSSYSIKVLTYMDEYKNVFNANINFN